MSSMTLFILLLCLPSLNFALSDDRLRPLSPSSLRRRSSRNTPAIGYYLPSANGGSMLTTVPGTFPPGQQEPINVILSGNSDADVLVDAQDNGGLRNFYQSFGFAGECLGQHSGSDQEANLGDGNGFKNETAVIRWDYGNPELGTCTETVEGGNHFRYWVQDGSQGDSGAIFMAISYELPIALQHDIIPNGFNLARDWLIGNITGSAINTSQITNTSTFTGQTSANGYTYQTNISYVSGLLPNTSIGINHNITVGVNGINAVDGLVAVMNVQISARPASSTSTGWRPTPLMIWQLPAIFISLIGAASLSALAAFL